MGRHPSREEPAQPLRIIQGKHREIMRRQIAGESQRRIALELGMSESRLSIICNSPLYKREYARLEQEVKGRFVEVAANVQNKVTELQPTALGVLEKILKEKEVDGIRVSLPLKRDTALDILELGGNGKKKTDVKNDAMADVVKIISDGFELAKQAMEERKRRDEVENPGAISIDVTPEQSTLEVAPDNTFDETLLLPKAV